MFGVQSSTDCTKELLAVDRIVHFRDLTKVANACMHMLTFEFPLRCTGHEKAGAGTTSQASHTPHSLMVSFIRSTATATFAIASIAAANPISTLETGDYYRPCGDKVSGVAGTDTIYHRSPCPALNALANHGYLPRDGLNITDDVLRDALMSVFNLDEELTQVLLDLVPSPFPLDYLSIHNTLEHDASLVHTDAYFGYDPASINATLVEDLMSRSIDGLTLGVAEIGAARADRLAECEANNPECAFGNHSTMAYTESAFFLLGFGGNGNESVSVEIARSFMSKERIPDCFVASTSPITLAEVQTVVGELMVAASS
ncbi:hypothetical protein BBJ28_00024501 [Nothophytophthora sp. Chile5]|nr:hypothetical protein BBJ28_00024501 [Nothophytophthora sp. Chile5]